MAPRSALFTAVGLHHNENVHFLTLWSIKLLKNFIVCF